MTAALIDGLEAYNGLHEGFLATAYDLQAFDPMGHVYSDRRDETALNEKWLICERCDCMGPRGKIEGRCRDCSPLGA